MLTIHALSSRTLATLAEIGDGVLWCLVSVDLDPVKGVLDDCGGHGFVVHAVSLQGQGSVSVADVPVRGLDLLDASCSHCLPVLVLCLHLALDLLHHRLHPRGGVLSRDKDAVALNVFHVFIIGAERGNACPYVPL